MGLISKLKGELVDIVEWVDDSRSTLAWRFPRYRNEFKDGAQLIVRGGQQAVFVYRGKIADIFGPGSYLLTTEVLPVLGSLQGWKHGFAGPFRSEVYFINTRQVTDLRWGTPQPVTIRDPDFGIVQVRANGRCVVQIDDPAVFLREVIGTDSAVEADEVAELLRRVITLAFADMVLSTRLGAIDLQARQVELAGQLRELVAERVDDEFGLAITDVMLNISLPEEITQAMTRGVAHGIEEGGYARKGGDVDRPRQVRTADAAVQAGMGVAMGAQLGAQMGAGGGTGAFPPPLPAAGPLFHVDHHGQPGGPYSMAQLQGAVGGLLTGDTLVWTAGMAAWARAREVPALQPLFSAPPPLPGAGVPPTAPTAPTGPATPPAGGRA